MTALAVIQARMGSSRFAGKMLARVGGSTLLERVIQRTNRLLYVDGRVVATSDQVRDDPIWEACLRVGIRCHRGPEDDVLSRIIGAVASWRGHVDTVVRICGDSPLWEVYEVDRLIRLVDRGGHDLVRYDRPCAIQGVDVISLRALELSRLHAGEDPRAREHVALYAHEEHERLGLDVVTLTPPTHLRGTERLSIDTPEDLERLRKRIEVSA